MEQLSSLRAAESGGWRRGRGGLGKADEQMHMMCLISLQHKQCNNISGIHPCPRHLEVPDPVLTGKTPPGAGDQLQTRC